MDQMCVSELGFPAKKNAVSDATTLLHSRGHPYRMRSEAPFSQCTSAILRALGGIISPTTLALNSSLCRGILSALSASRGLGLLLQILRTSMLKSGLSWTLPSSRRRSRPRFGPTCGIRRRSRLRNGTSSAGGSLWCRRWFKANVSYTWQAFSLLHG